MYQRWLPSLHIQKGEGEGGAIAISIPTIPSPAPTQKKTKILLFMDNQKNGPPNPLVPNVSETTPTVVWTRTQFLEKILGKGGGLPLEEKVGLAQGPGRHRSRGA